MAARNYDRSLVRLRGPGAATNFGLADYRTDLADYHKMQQVWMDSILSKYILARYVPCVRAQRLLQWLASNARKRMPA